MYSVQNALHPDKCSLHVRLATFYNQQWPGHRMRATTQQFAEAGLFYLGVSDKVKCWYCNGGLCNWDEDDDPWFEHAKYFPHCEFLRHNRPPSYVDDVISTHYGDRNSTMRAHVNTTVNIIRPGNNIRLQQTTDNIQMQVNDFLSEIQGASSNRATRFANSFVRSAVEREFQQGNEVPIELENILNSLINLRPNEERPSRDSSASGGLTSNNSSVGSSSNSSGNNEESESLPESMVSELERLREDRLCKRCRRQPASMVFIPCGHIHSCTECVYSYEDCPVCSSHVSERIRAYNA